MTTKTRKQILLDAMGDASSTIKSDPKCLRWIVSDPDLVADFLSTLPDWKISERIMELVDKDWRRGNDKHSFRDADIIWPYVLLTAQSLGWISEADLWGIYDLEGCE